MANGRRLRGAEPLPRSQTLPLFMIALILARFFFLTLLRLGLSFGLPTLPGKPWRALGRPKLEAHVNETPTADLCRAQPKPAS